MKRNNQKSVATRVVESLKFLMGLTHQVFGSFATKTADVLYDAGFEDEQTQMFMMIQELSQAAGRSRRNYEVDRCMELLKLIKGEVAVVSKALRLQSDESEVKALAIYNLHLKGQASRGMREYIGRVKGFLEDLGDLEFDGTVADKISTIRILVSRYDSAEHDKQEQVDEIKGRQKAATVRIKLYDAIVRACTKLADKDEKDKSTHCQTMLNMVDDYRSIYLRRKHVKDDPNAGEADEQRKE